MAKKKKRIKISALEDLVTKVAKNVLDEIESDMIKAEVITSEDREGELSNLFQLWEKLLTELNPKTPSYWEFKKLFLEIFEEEELDYWFSEKEGAYIMSICWSVCYGRLDISKYGTSKRKLFKEMKSHNESWSKNLEIHKEKRTSK